MTPIVGIIMGTSDLPVMEKAAQLLNDLHVPFGNECSFGSPHTGSCRRVCQECTSQRYKGYHCSCRDGCSFAGSYRSIDTTACYWRSYKIILDGMDARLAIVQMPPGIPVATVGINGALNAAILAVRCYLWKQRIRNQIHCLQRRT